MHLQTFNSMLPWGGVFLYMKLPAMKTTAWDGKWFRVTVVAKTPTVWWSRFWSSLGYVIKTFFKHRQVWRRYSRSFFFLLLLFFSQRHDNLPLTPPTQSPTPSANNTNMACFHSERSAVQESHEVQQLAESPLRGPDTAGCQDVWRLDRDQQEAPACRKLRA